ncbi:Plancitoxin-1 [Holothuria leucospilota]|uniref:Plancitoxin-1 n=1 Tax=Holothuria leucospilota TaxID=206669 RepID=A0A9Q1C4D8_HOLLE|nr:Plancitoxin-1 [Holothuria leucospilota]
MKGQYQPVAQTLQQIYNQPQMIAYIMYSDHPPDGKEKHPWGHTKGVVAYDESNGFWMIHSLPKFPRKDRYKWAENASLYGHGILCVSFKPLGKHREALSFAVKVVSSTSDQGARRIGSEMAGRLVKE